MSCVEIGVRHTGQSRRLPSRARVPVVKEAPTNPDATVTGQWLVPVTTAEALALLGTVHLGRIAYTDRALPGIQVVSHMIDDGDIISAVTAGRPSSRPRGPATPCWPARRQSTLRRSAAGGSPSPARPT